MKIIVDTNVLISAVLKGKNARDVIQFIIDQSNFDWIVSQEILEEYREVLKRPKFKIPNETRNQWLNKIETIPQLVEVNVKINFPRDPKDAKFLALARASQADFLITGDKDFDEVKEIGKTVIISVYYFKNIFINKEVKN
ncbi:nucleotide binding protein, PINc [Planktothrix agardhii CCAP 1459/11A]|jgi:putative PIN family toxin of toxin-antitoxin system|uniref:Nucleotide binding protein, PINc n=1 Tax=Planktothrix agardhii CCAP 1459/11A TaxID=282420 RepID=A0A4P5ZS70_PLAAG|nr:MULTISPECIES: putative toxin-antitoxin system toxin component, PIN family [Planktothrix]GDZ92391.1 nucleotide binding protein, PINc [Planktothrix agardhii CCAP 1459/11A]CAD5957475.1 putative nucleic acid-binding protein, contains PIN domain [Planktothrix rubescens]CAH2575380.1 putative nucleic acid-binding protein, contains PIN domain [Planktothrix rubescens]